MSKTKLKWEEVSKALCGNYRLNPKTGEASCYGQDRKCEKKTCFKLKVLGTDLVE